jgi:hypothetical protein
LNMDAACKFKKSDISTYNLSAAINNQNWHSKKGEPGFSSKGS